MVRMWSTNGRAGASWGACQKSNCTGQVGRWSALPTDLLKLSHSFVPPTNVYGETYNVGNASQVVETIASFNRRSVKLQL